MIALLLTLRIGKPRDILISVVWSPFTTIYFILIQDCIRRLLYLNHFDGVTSPKPCMLTDRGIFGPSK
nr:MAG TPA: hypothetical protein [Caudoviricetes sp.]